ncbi:MAG: hypothetical protein LQ350_002861 [Teloschistes chrysophthalmus]|nr:MAG: hypothetical protein LQ350_002861 [Niorma chrysophthalma]
MASPNIKFIPPQMADPSKYTTRANRQGPLWLLLKDTCILISVLHYLPLVFWPLKSKNGDGEKKTSWASVRDIFVQGLLFIIETIILILFIPALVSLPGILFFAVSIACGLLIQLIAWPAQGPRLVQSNMNPETLKESGKHQDERWVFINGICTCSSGLQQNVDRLSLLFGRSVLGIHNQSVGMIGDVFECILQRCLSYKTMDVRVACEIVKGCLMDPEAKKVVLIGHSQGGIIVSMVLDQLFPELPNESMSKLEIYTFGSAASHFHNPPILPRTDATGSSPVDCIKYIEHYANEYDMVPRWGVLYATRALLTNRYAGAVFVHMGATGHMFIQHYLDRIFPVTGGTAKAHSGPAVKTNGLTGNGHVVQKNGDSTSHLVQPQSHRVEEAQDVEMGGSYLDGIPVVDEQASANRYNVNLDSLVKPKKHVAASISAKPTATTDGDAAAIMDGNAHRTGSFVVVKGIPSTQTQKYGGRTVRQISRLWLYLGGRSPPAEK